MWIIFYWKNDYRTAINSLARASVGARIRYAVTRKPYDLPKPMHKYDLGIQNTRLLAVGKTFEKYNETDLKQIYGPNLDFEFFWFSQQREDKECTDWLDYHAPRFNPRVKGGIRPRTTSSDKIQEALEQEAKKKREDEMLLELARERKPLEEALEQLKTIAIRTIGDWLYQKFRQIQDNAMQTNGKEIWWKANIVLNLKEQMWLTTKGWKVLWYDFIEKELQQFAEEWDRFSTEYIEARIIPIQHKFDEQAEQIIEKSGIKQRIYISKYEPTVRDFKEYLLQKDGGYHPNKEYYATNTRRDIGDWLYSAYNETRTAIAMAHRSNPPFNFIQRWYNWWFHDPRKLITEPERRDNRIVWTYARGKSKNDPIILDDDDDEDEVSDKE